MTDVMYKITTDGRGSVFLEDAEGAVLQSFVPEDPDDLETSDDLNDLGRLVARLFAKEEVDQYTRTEDPPLPVVTWTLPELQRHLAIEHQVDNLTLTGTCFGIQSVPAPSLKDLEEMHDRFSHHTH